jgi:CheY-like chemotaxis protein
MQEPTDHRSATILVVDDDESLRLLMVSLLTRSGYRTLAARNGDEALRILAGEPGIDLLLTDIVMPGQLDGFALAAQALQLRPTLKIIYTSGYIRKSDAIGSRPPAPIIKKPWHPAALRAEIAAALQPVAEGGAAFSALGAE